MMEYAIELSLDHSLAYLVENGKRLCSGNIDTITAICADLQDAEIETEQTFSISPRLFLHALINFGPQRYGNMRFVLRQPHKTINVQLPHNRLVQIAPDGTIWGETWDTPLPPFIAAVAAAYRDGGVQ